MGNGSVKGICPAWMYLLVCGIVGVELGIYVNQPSLYLGAVIVIGILWIASVGYFIERRNAHFD